MFCARGRLSLDGGFISQTSTDVGAEEEEKKNRISARRASHQFPSALTDHNRTSTDNPSIGRWQCNFNLRNPPPDVLSGSSVRLNSASRRNAARSIDLSPISHIIRRSIDSYVDTPVRFSGKLAHDWSLFKASHDADREFAIVRNCMRHVDALCLKGGEN